MAELIVAGDTWANIRGRINGALGDGGVFRLSSGGEDTDGGIVHAVAQSAVVQAVVARTELDGYQLQHENLIWGSVSLAIGGKTISDLELHGHRMNTEGAGFGPLVDHGAGQIHDPQGLLQAYTAGEDVETVTVSYRYATTTGRWVRRFEHRTASLKWWGVSDGDEVRDLLCWALNACHRLGLRELRLDGSYIYRGTIEIPDGVTLTSGTLTVADDAVEVLRSDYEPETIAWLGGQYPLIVPADGAARAGLRDVTLDGNYAGNLGPWTDPEEYPTDDIEDMLRDTPVFNGFASTSHGGRDVPDGQVVTVERVTISGFLGNCLLGGLGQRWSISDVTLGNSLHNHLLYNCPGNIAGLRCFGFWHLGGAIIYDNSISGIRFEDITEHPLEDGNHSSVLNYRGSDYGDGTYDDIYNHRFCRIDGMVVDLNAEGHSVQRVFDTLGAGFSVSGLRVTGSPERSVALFRRTGNNPTGLDEAWALRDVTGLENGYKLALGMDATAAPVSGLVVDGLTIKSLRGASDPSSGPPLMQITASTGGDPRFGTPQVWSLSRVVDSTPRLFLFGLTLAEGAAGLDVVVRDSQFALSSNTVFRAPNGQGSLASLPDAPGLIRVHFERCLFVIDPELPYAQNLELFLACSTFHECHAFWDGVRETVAERWPSE